MDGELLEKAKSIFGDDFPIWATARAFIEQFGGEVLQPERPKS